jgi:hypothetical protein
VGRSEEDLQAAARFVGAELVQLAAMPNALKAAERNGDRHAANACLESMLLHARNLMEFLIEPSWAPDAHRTDFAPGWSLPNSAATKRLLDAREMVDRHVSHLRWERVKDDSPDREPGRLADDLVEVMGLFVEHLEAEDNRAAEWFNGHVLEAHLLLRQRPVGEQEWNLTTSVHEGAAATDSSRVPTSAISLGGLLALACQLRSGLGVTVAFLAGVVETGLRGLLRRQDDA